MHKENAPPDALAVLQKIEDGGARVLNMYRAVAHSPAAGEAFIRLGATLLRKTKLSPKLRELVILRIAHLCGSEYEWRQHVPVALELGVTQEHIDAIPTWQASRTFSDPERAALKFTDEVTQNVTVRDETFQSLRRFFDEQEIVELTLANAYWGAVARVLVALQVDVDVQSMGSAEELMGRRQRPS